MYALLLVGAFIVYASANAPVPIAQELRAELALAPGGGAGVFLAPFAVGFGAGCAAWFIAARARHARPVLSLALAVTAAGGVIVAIATEPALMNAGRVLAGLGAAGYPAVAQAVIANGTDPAARGRMIGGFITAVVAGSFAGQALVGLLADAASPLTALVVVCALAPAAAAMALWRALPAATPPRTAARVPHLPPRAAAPVLVVSLLAFGGYWLLLSALPAVLRTERYGLDASAAGALPMIGLLGAAAALTTGRVGDRRGRRMPAVTTLAAGVAALALTVPTTTPLWLFAAGYGLFLAAYWGLLPPASAEVAARADAETRQAALMAFYAAMWLGAALTPAVAAFISGWEQAALAGAGAWICAALLAALTFGARPAAAAEAPGTPPRSALIAPRGAAR